MGYAWEYGWSMLAAVALTFRIWLREGFDVLHAHNPPDTFVLIAVILKLLGTRFVFDHHDLSPEMYQARFPEVGSQLVCRALAVFEKLSCRMADLVLAPNESYKLIEEQRDKVAPERIAIVRNGPDLDRIRLVDPDPGLRAKGKTIIGFVGVMGFQDGVDCLLRAFDRLIHELGRTDFYAVLIGTGDAHFAMRALATHLRLDSYVSFTGRIPDADMLRYLSAADICVDPAPANPFTDASTMIKMMEYMALGKPIVAFDLREHRFTAESAALYVRPNDELAFARAIAGLMDEPDRREAMGAFGRRRVAMALAWDHSASKLLQAYNRLFQSFEGRQSPSKQLAAASKSPGHRP